MEVFRAVVACYLLYLGGSAVFGYSGGLTPAVMGSLCWSRRSCLELMQGCRQSRRASGMGTDKNVQHMCDMNNLHMQQGGFFVSVRSVGTWGALLGGREGGWGGKRRKNECRHGKKAVSSVACL